ncbi:hypothetical protein IB252_10710 [Pseudomonas sp. PDM10]|uniref:hypothetical protein n=1 Tax=Pseudomonas sp. PDM10 TaxID=2769269 RepID=UPI0017829916|nr:hypothetical protein [Pseudomonas sp. PDM10]MBD9600273.1 hypothetical protein [Pseudomonas sp. PDM10]
MKENADPPLPSLRQNRISFDAMAQEEPLITQGPRPLRIERTFPNRGMGWVDLSVLGERPALAQSLLIGVQHAVDACGSPSSMHSYHHLLCTFERVMQKREASGAAPINKLDDITVPVLSELSEGFMSLAGASTGYQRLARIKRLLLNIENINPGTISEDVLQQLCLGSGNNRPIRIAHKQPYTDHEFYQIEKACRDDIRKTIARLSTEAEELRHHGKDPREYGWAKLENQVWFLENVNGGQFVSSKELRKQTNYQWRKTSEAIRAIYPILEDMIPFYLLLCIKTALNPESAMRLKRNCLDEKHTTPHETLLHYVKLRSSGPMVLPVRTEGTFSPGGLIRTYLKLSDRCHELSNDESLWLVIKHKRSNSISAPTSNSFARAVCQFAERHKLNHDDGAPLQLRADRLRTTRKTLSYRHSNGDYGLAGHDHRRDSTTVDYINNSMTEDIHNQAIMNGQHQFHAFFSGAVVPDGSSTIEVAKIINTDIATAEAILNGQQEMLIADCKDMFNAPGGEPGKLCVKVWACFGCQNSIWTSRILPKVLWYMDFFLEQRRMIAAQEWEKKFGYPYRLITNYILPAFSAETIALARTEAKELSPYVPPEMRTF